MPAVDYLQQVDIFRSLPQEELDLLFRGMMVRECNPGTVFFTPEDATEELFILKQGQVQLYRLTSSGKRLVTKRISPGTVFGEMGVLGQSMQGCFAEATEDSLVCVARREDILKLFEERPEVALRLFEAVGKRLKALEDRLEQLAFSPVKARLATFLLGNLDPQTGAVSGFTHEEIGDTIGTIRQTVTETLNEMQRQGLVKVGHKRIEVLQRKAIEDLAAEGGLVLPG
ncbi:MAG: Crp/Fnr family transcriptional regulator [Chloroflexi bacterium]|nr:Crp/Fnr family transcriptional regulator [Chloroflexota bacterium]